MPDEQPNDRSEQPPYFARESTWQELVLAAAGVFVIGLVAGTLALVFNGADDLTENTEIFWRLSVIGGAVVTFATVMWRGLVASRQADQQREQVDAQFQQVGAQMDQLSNMERQLEQSDATFLASMLQDGARMLDETEKPSQVIAAISALEMVASGRNPSFRAAAVDVLGGYLETHYAGRNTTATDATIEALASVHRIHGEQSSRWLMMEGPPVDESEIADAVGKYRWRPVRGFRHVMYRGGVVSEWLSNEPISDFAGLFVDTWIFAQKELVVPSGRFHNCTFFRSSIAQIDHLPVWENKFIECDFSGAHLLVADVFEPNMFVGRDNTFRREDPPVVVRENGDEVGFAETGWNFLVPKETDRASHSNRPPR